MEFHSLKQVRDYLDTIPDNRWIKHRLFDDFGRRCALGHLNEALHDHPDYTEDTTNADVNVLLSKFGVNWWALANANNSHLHSPKQGVLEYLDTIIKM